MYSGVQHTHATGVLWVQDMESAETGEVLLLWIDEKGQVIRSVRVPGDEINAWPNMFDMYADQECPWWQTALTGEAYLDAASL